MPLLKKKPFVCEEPPDNLEPDDLVFYCKLTGEVFTDYESVTLLFIPYVIMLVVRLFIFSLLVRYQDFLQKFPTSFQQNFACWYS